MENWNDSSKNISAAMETIAKHTEGLTSKFTDYINIFCSSIEFQRFINLINSIPDDIQKTQFFRKCQKLTKDNLTYEEVSLLFSELDILNLENAHTIIQKYIDNNNAIHNYIKSIMESKDLEDREKLVIILCHFERLIYSTLRHEKKRREKTNDFIKNELLKNNHGMDRENLYKTTLLAITNVVFANTDNFTNVDKRLPFRNNILHRGIVDYSDKDINIAYNLLLIFVAHIIRMNDFFIK